jgi:hypothetical protein
MNTWSEHKETLPALDVAFDWAREGNFYALTGYFREGGNVNQKNHEGHSLLMLTACHDHWGLSAWLIRHGADVNSIDLSGNSILMAACMKGHSRLVKLLLHSGADPFLQNAQGQTAVDFAKAFKHEHVVGVLCGEPLFH